MRIEEKQKSAFGQGASRSPYTFKCGTQACLKDVKPHWLWELIRGCGTNRPRTVGQSAHGEAEVRSTNCSSGWVAS